MKIIILNVTPFKEKDAIVTAISEAETISFTVHGALDTKSKNAALINLFTIADIRLNETNKIHKSLKESEIIYSPFSGKYDLASMMCMSLISENIKYLLQDDEKPQMFTLLENALTAFSKGKDPYLVSLNVIARILDIAGYGLNVNSCARCGGKKDIIIFSFEDGGFICKNCAIGETSDLSIEEMKIIRNAFISKDLSFSSFAYSKTKTKGVLIKLLNYITNCFDINFKNIELL